MMGGIKRFWSGESETPSHLERAIVCPEADAGHILEPNRKATATNTTNKTWLAYTVGVGAYMQLKAAKKCNRRIGLCVFSLV